MAPHNKKPISPVNVPDSADETDETDGDDDNYIGFSNEEDINMRDHNEENEETDEEDVESENESVNPMTHHPAKPTETKTLRWTEVAPKTKQPNTSTTPGNTPGHKRPLSTFSEIIANEIRKGAYSEKETQCTIAARELAAKEGREFDTRALLGAPHESKKTKGKGKTSATMTPPATKKRKEGQQEISLRQMLENSTLPPPRERSARYLASNDTTTLKKQNNSLIFSIPHLRMFDRNRQHPSEDIVLQILQQHDVPRDQIIGMRFAQCGTGQRCLSSSVRKEESPCSTGRASANIVGSLKLGRSPGYC
ncbi:hypothetical protein C358_03114 [Cryptococcus neoformans MW-RSA852]|nr:hypothetical protein C358_03114 [Cryptococcus neoformans var. grubii MW-RSA852]